MKSKIYYLLFVILFAVANTSFAQQYDNSIVSSDKYIGLQIANGGQSSGFEGESYSLLEMYTIYVYSADESMGSVYGGGTYSEGDYAYMEAYPYDGYVFSHWSDGNTSIYRYVEVTGNAEYTAYFEVDTRPFYTITVYSADESMGSVYGGGEYREGDYVYIEAYPNDGYVFSHWSDESTSSYRHVQVTGDAEYIAYFEVDTRPIYTVTVYSEDEMKGTVHGGGEYREGTEAYIYATPRDGFVFSHWSDGNTSRSRYVYVTSDVTYTAYFEEDTRPIYTISVYSENLAKGTVRGGGEFREGSSVSISASPRYGYVFSQWNDGNTSNSRYVDVTGNATYTAYFEVDPRPIYTISVRSDNLAKGTVSGGGEFREGTSASISASPRYGYVFSQWNDGNTSSSRDVQVTSNATYTAYFEVDTRPIYTISVYSSDVNKGSVYGGGEYREGTSLYIEAYSNTGYVFSHWNDGNTSSYRNVQVTGNAEYTAYFEEDTRPIYTVSVISDNETMGTVRGGGEYREGSYAYIYATPKDGYLFSHWNDGNTSSSRDVEVTRDITYTAYFELDTRPTYTISVNSENETKGTVSGSGVYRLGSSVSISASPKTGFFFSHWNDGNASSSRTVQVTRDITYTAYFELDTRPIYTVSVRSDNLAKGTVSGGGRYSEGTSISIYASPRYGYIFSHWSDGCASSSRSVYVTGNVTYTAYFVADPRPIYTLSVFSEDIIKGSVSGSGEYRDGTSVSISASPKSGYVFSHWSDGNTSSSRNVYVTGNVIYTAYFDTDTRPIYSVSVFSENVYKGTVRGSGEYREGTSVYIEASPKNGYVFSHWSDGNTSSYRNVQVTGNAEYTAYFEEDMRPLYTVTVNSENETKGTVHGGGEYREGTEVYIYATAQDGFVFSHWSDGNTSRSRYVYATSDVTYTAYFESDTRPTYTVSVNSENETKGTVSGEGTYRQGTTVYIEAYPNNGYVFSHWNDGSSSSYRSIQVTGNVTYTAYFELDTRPLHTVSVYSEDEMKGTVRGGGECLEGTYAYIYATPKDNYIFSHWNDGNTSSSRSVQVLRDVTYTAYFVLDTRPYHTVSVYSEDETKGTVRGGGAYREGSTAYIYATAQDGFVFSHWNDGSTSSSRSVQVLRDITFTAYFVFDTRPIYTVSVYSEDETKGTVRGGGDYREGTYAYIYATPQDGFVFSHWNDGNTSSSREIYVTSDVTYTAYFEVDTRPIYTVSVYSYDEYMGSVSGSGEYYEGEYAYIYATPQEGYVFSHWSDGSTSRSRSVLVSGNATYTAYFEIDIRPYYTIYVYSTDESMGFVYGGGQFREGSSTYLRAVPHEGYRFVRWNDGNTERNREIVITCDANYYAYFEEASSSGSAYTIYVYSDNTDMGTVSGGGTYREGDVVLLTATPNSGYRFVSWSDGSVDEYHSVIVTGYDVYIAYFIEEAFHSISVYANDVRGFVTGGGTYITGEQVELEAHPNAGYHFVRWSDNITDNPRNIIVIGDASYIALFESNDVAGIDDDVISDISIYPNPVSSIVNITAPDEMSKIEILSASGNVVKIMEVNGNTAVCDIDELSQGVYFVRIFVDSDNPIVRKLIKE